MDSYRLHCVISVYTEIYSRVELHLVYAWSKTNVDAYTNRSSVTANWRKHSIFEFSNPMIQLTVFNSNDQMKLSF